MNVAELIMKLNEYAPLQPVSVQDDKGNLSRVNTIDCISDEADVVLNVSDRFVSDE